MNSAPQIPTVGSIAARFGVSVHQVRYLIATRGIAPTGRAGKTRIFSNDDVLRIQAELNRIALTRGATRD